MPSKRTLAKNLGVSTITVENAYDQLIGEGYMFARPKRGYFIADVSDIRIIKAPVQKELSIKLPPEQDESIFDFSSNRTDTLFPLRLLSDPGPHSYRETMTGGLLSLPEALSLRHTATPTKAPAP